MSNILNLKAVKLFAIIVLAVALLATFGMVAVQSASADCTVVPTVRVGSTGVNVQCVQTIVGATADGKFGPLTKASVMAWQSGHALTADGVVGPLTAAKMNLGGSVSGNFPAGCTSAAGYSSTTGVKCDSSNANTFPAGCTSASGYSPTTGTKCDSSQGSNNNSGGSLVGGAGDITVTELSSPSSSTKVGEGSSDVKVLGIEVEADDGSDIQITSMRFTLAQSDSDGSDRLDRYAKSVSVWMGSTKVGSADADEFSESSGTYTKSINLSNAIVRADKTEKFYLSVDAINDIDSGNTGSSENLWTATLTSTRFEDATGAILTDSTSSIANTHIYDTLSNTGDVELKVALSGTKAASTVKVSTTATTNQVELLKFTLKAQNSAMVVDQIPVLFTSNESDLDQVASNVTLVIDGETFNESVSTSAAATATISFDDLDLSLAENETLTGTIYADVLEIESGTHDEGTTLYASITSALVATIGSSAGALDVEDVNGDQLATGDRSGSAVGNTMTFRSEGVNAVLGTPTYTETFNDSGVVTQVEYKIPVKVTAFGDTLFLGQLVQLAEDATASAAFAIVFENSTDPTTASTTSSGTFTLAPSTSGNQAQTESNGFRLDDGTTFDFTITATHITPSAAGSFRIRLDEIQTFTEAGLITPTDQDLLPQSSYRTDFKYIGS